MIYDLRSLTDRRQFLLRSARALMAASVMNPLSRILSMCSESEKAIKVTKMEVFAIKVTDRTKWIVIRLSANNGMTGLGEASLGRQAAPPQLRDFFALIEGQSPFDVQKYRERAWSKKPWLNRQHAAAFSSIEQALWDIVGKTLDTPVYQLFGGKLRESIPLYANINRATTRRDPEAFAKHAELAVSDGFKAIKAAPFDGFPPLTGDAKEIKRALDLGIDCISAMREAVGDEIKIMIDAHSHFDVEMSIEVAKAIEPANLYWLEEPVNPEEVENTKLIQDSINQTLAGGEFLFGIKGFGPLCEAQAVDVIMPDVKYCGGLLEAFRIAALAEYHGIVVAPHNPSGPVATSASAALCASLPNFSILEYQWGETPWRSRLIDPPEAFQNGNIQIGNRSGLGISLNEEVMRAHL